MGQFGADRGGQVVLDVAHRHAARIQADDDLVEAAEPPGSPRHQPRSEATVAIPRHRQLDVADLTGNGLRARAVARIRKQRRLRVAALIADMIGQLDLQATLQGSFQHALQQPVITTQRHIAGVDLLKNLIQRTRGLQPISQLSLTCTPLSALCVLHRGHRGSSVLSTRWITAYTKDLTPPGESRYGQQLRARGKKGGVIGCAMAHRANKIAYALVRDQSGYDADRWA